MFKNIPLLVKIVIHLLVIFIVVYFFTYFNITPKTNKTISNKEEVILYAFMKAQYVEKLYNNLGEEVKPKDEEKFLRIYFSVNNKSNRDIFYVSIVEDPKIFTTDNIEYYPDLSISDEPFGNIINNRTKEGFLSFRIPKDKKVKMFKIGNFAKEIKNID
jgi:hypothetical protein